MQVCSGSCTDVRAVITDIYFDKILTLQQKTGCRFSLPPQLEMAIVTPYPAGKEFDYQCSFDQPPDIFTISMMGI